MGADRRMHGAARRLLLLRLLGAWRQADGWVSLSAANTEGAYPDVVQHVVGDFDTRTDANHITFQDDWQLYTGSDVFEIRSHSEAAADADVQRPAVALADVWLNGASATYALFALCSLGFFAGALLLPRSVDGPRRSVLLKAGGARSDDPQ